MSDVKQCDRYAYYSLEESLGQWFLELPDHWTFFGAEVGIVLLEWADSRNRLAKLEYTSLRKLYCVLKCIVNGILKKSESKPQKFYTSNITYKTENKKHTHKS